jgi:AcrR family transcriptional regulator
VEPTTTDRRRVKPAGERRREILDAAVRLFRDRGFDETTVQDIAEGAGVAAGTLYLHFRSKEHLLQAIHEEFERGLEERFGEVGLEVLARQQRGEPVDSRWVCDAMWDGAFAYNLEQRALLEVTCRYIPRLDAEQARQLDAAHSGFLTELLRRGTELGFIHAEDPESTGYLLAALNVSVARAVAFDEPGLDRLVAQAKEIYYRALALPDAP